MKHKLAFLGMVLGMMALILGIALSMFEVVATDAVRYDALQAKLDVYPSVGVERAQLREVQRDVASYLKGESDQINREVTMFGQLQMVFNARELEHMQDVRALFALERSVRFFALLLAVVLLALSLLLMRLIWRARFIRRSMRKIAHAALWALGTWAALGLGACLLCGFDFGAAFIRFHELLFTNDLWMLNPQTDAMIRMYPETFFMWMARDIGISMGLGALIVIVPSLAGFLPERMTPRR